jgi:acyl carrier protein
MEVIAEEELSLDYRNGLKDFIKEEILHGRAVNLDEDQDLLSAGIIDSLGILRIVAFMEENLGIGVKDEDVVFENFQSIRLMAQYVEQRKQAAS